jgi:hypothetical protein
MEKKKLKLGGLVPYECDEQTASGGASGAYETAVDEYPIVRREYNEEEIAPNDGDSVGSYDFKTHDFQLPLNYQKFKKLIKDIKHYRPDLASTIDFLVLQYTAHGEINDWPNLMEDIVGLVDESGMVVGPDWTLSPNPQMNEVEQEMEEQTTSASSGSYETTGAWATGKGKNSIKNSRAAKSKQFKKNLYGGPKAKYVSVKGSVNTLSESSDIYNESSKMKFSKAQIERLVENTIKQEVVNVLNDKPKKAYLVKEDTFLKMIDSMITEDKKHPGLAAYNKAHKESGTINKKSNSDTDKNIKAFNKAKGNDNPEFPFAIGSGEKKARKNTEKQDEFIEDFKGSSMEDLTYDQEPGKDFKDRSKKALTGDSKMGNAKGKDTANTIDTKTGDDLIKKANRKKKKEDAAPMYKKDVQPTGKQDDDGEADLKGNALNESDIVLENEMAKIKKLYTYSDRTQ